MAAQGIQNLGHTLQQKKKMSICNIDDQELFFIALSIPFVAHTKKEKKKRREMMTAIHLRCPKGSFYIFCAARTQQEANRHHDVNDIFVSLFKKGTFL